VGVKALKKWVAGGGDWAGRTASTSYSSSTSSVGDDTESLL